MWQIIKVKVQPLNREAFKPFGEVIESFEEARPEIRKGGLTKNAYTVTAELSKASDANSQRVPLSEGPMRAHFACHTDAGQAFYPSRHCPTVFFVAPIKENLTAEDVRAFYSDGSLGICVRIGVWHTMPICVEGTEVYQTVRGNQDYHAHSVEIHFDDQQGIAFEPDLTSLDKRLVSHP